MLTEFQLVDQQTALENERGDSSHDAYKERQHRSVRMRLMRGLEKHNPRREAARASARPRTDTRSGVHAVPRTTRRRRPTQ